MLRSLRFWIGAVVSVGFLALFLARSDLGDMGAALRGADPRFAAPALVVYFCGVWLRAWRWRLLLLPVGAVSVRRLFAIEIIGYMVNNVLPLRAGELARVYVVGAREGLSKAAVLATIAIERAFDGVCLLAFVVGVALATPLPSWLAEPLRVIAALFVAALVGFVVAALFERQTMAAVGLLLRPLPAALGQRLEGLLRLFIVGLRGLGRPTLAMSALAISALSWLAEAGTYYIVALAFEPSLSGQPFSVLLLMASVANLAIALPSSQGGIGPFEYFAASTLGVFGVEAATANAYALALHALLLVPVIAAGFVCLWLTNLSWGQLMARPAATAGETESAR